MPPVSSLRRPIGGCAATCTTRRPSRGITTNLVTRGDALNRGERNSTREEVMAQKAPVMVPSDMSVEDVADRARGPRRAEVDDLIAMHQQITGEESRVWAGRIIGFGEYEYRYPSGHGGTAPLLAFAPGPSNHTIYLVSGFAERWPEAPCRPRPPQGEQSLPVHHASRKGRSGGFAGAPRAVAAGDNAGSGTPLNGERRGHNNVQPRRSALVLTCPASPRLSADGESSPSQRGSALIHWRSPGSAAHRGGN